MAFDFPDTPAIGDTYPNPALPGAPVYRWDGEKWTGPSGGATAANVWTQDTAPPIAAAKDGDLWWETDTGKLFVAYDDGSSLQWVSTQTPQGGWYVAKSGDVMSGALTAPYVIIDKPAANTDAAFASSVGGAIRWRMVMADATTSDFKLTSFNDSGAYLGNPLSILRSNNLVNLCGIGAAQYTNSSGALPGSCFIALNKVAGQQGSILGTTNGVMRWNLSLGDSSAESGGNAGANFALGRYGDGGTKINDILTIVRSTGTASFQGALYVTSGNIVTMATGAGNAQVAFADNAGNIKGYCYWNAAANSMSLTNSTSTGILQLLANGSLSYSSTAQFKGYAGLQGYNGGAFGSIHNWFWGGGFVQCWVDTTNVGNVTTSSDYRVKKDVADLPSMWERAKGLRPISYTHQDYTPPGANTKDADGVEMGPFIKADDKERWGFVAHELQDTLIEDAATGVKDSPDHIQSPNPWTVIATLTKALQEAMARIEALEARA